MIEDKSLDAEVGFYCAQYKCEYNKYNLLISAKVFCFHNSFDFCLSQEDLERIKYGEEFIFVRKLESSNLLKLNFLEFLDIV